MKATEIRDMTADEMRRKVSDLKQELFNLQFQLEVGQLENKARIRQTKQDIARLMTVLRQTQKPQSVKA